MLRLLIFICTSVLFGFNSYGQKKKFDVQSGQKESKFLSLKGYEIDLGTVSINDSLKFSIPFKNTGSDTLLIQKVASSCSCTKIIFSKDGIAPTEEGEIQLLYLPKKDINLGFATIQVHYNSMDSPIFINMKAKVKLE